MNDARAAGLESPTRRELATQLLRTTATSSAAAGMEPGERAHLDLAGVQRQVLVVDTMVIARGCAGITRGRAPALFAILGSARSTVLVAEHVPTEVPRAIARICGADLLAAHRALEVWTEVVAPKLRLVRLPFGELLRPEIQEVARGSLHPRRRGDPDDTPTIALAAFVAPAVILSADTIFVSAGLAAQFDDVRAALDILTSAESVAWSFTLFVEVTGGGLGHGFAGLKGAAARHPEAAALVCVALCSLS